MDITLDTLLADARRPASGWGPAAARRGLADISLGSLWAAARSPASAGGSLAARWRLADISLGSLRADARRPASAGAGGWRTLEAGGHHSGQSVD